MASNARPGGSPNSPAGQPASDEATGEVGVDAAVVAGTSEVGGSGRGPTGTGAGFGREERRGEDTYPPSGHASGAPPGWPAPPPVVRADGWDADSTAAWDPSSAWAAEDSEGPDDGGGSWDEAPDWEGEIVRWEAERPETGPSSLVPSDWTGAPTAPPGYTGEYLPAHLSQGDEAVAVYAGRGASPAPALGGIYDRKDGKGGSRTRRENGPWRELVIITAVAVILSALILALTTAEKSDVAGLGSLFGSPGTTSRGASPPAATAAGAATSARSSTAPNARTALTTAPKVGTPATLSQRAKSLPVTAGVAQSLVRSWLASNPGGYGMGPADVAGTVPNEVYYAVQPATGTYWALAAFKPSAALMAQSSTQTGQEELAEFHDSAYAFSWQAGPVWTLLGEYNTGSCPDVWVPRAVLAAWSLCGL
jgi:hypothetical protein